MKLIKYTLALLTAASLTSCGDDFLNEFDKQVITSDQVKDETEKNPDKALAPYVRGLYEDWNFCAAMGGRNGGPAKAAVIGSGLFGMISGVAVANVVTTGSITIPMMKRKGYSPEFAGAVETVASTGGALMPPVMGALAFIMADYMGVPYWQIASAAILPAVLYYVAVYLQVSFYSSRHRLGGLNTEEIPMLKKVLRDGWPFILPLFIMVYLFARYGWDAMRVGFTVILVVAAIYFCQSLFKRREKIGVPLKGVYHYSVDMLESVVEEMRGCGVMSCLLFGIPDHKDECGSGAYAEDGIVQKAFREAKKCFPDLYCIGDVCMCEYTSHGHCGILRGDYVDNDKTLDYLARIALSQVQDIKHQNKKLLKEYLRDKVSEMLYKA